MTSTMSCNHQYFQMSRYSNVDSLQKEKALSDKCLNKKLFNMKLSNNYLYKSGTAQTDHFYFVSCHFPSKSVIITFAPGVPLQLECSTTVNTNLHMHIKQTQHHKMQQANYATCQSNSNSASSEPVLHCCFFQQRVTSIALLLSYFLPQFFPPLPPTSSAVSPPPFTTICFPENSEYACFCSQRFWFCSVMQSEAWLLA